MECGLQLKISVSVFKPQQQGSTGTLSPSHTHISSSEREKTLQPGTEMWRRLKPTMLLTSMVKTGISTFSGKHVTPNALTVGFQEMKV